MAVPIKSIGTSAGHDRATFPCRPQGRTFCSHSFAHRRGKEFEYNLIRPGGRIMETLLRVHYDFHWQLSYRLATPRVKSVGEKTGD